MLAPDGIPIPRLVIAAPQGRSGKTTLSLGLCSALVQRGLAVQPFKKGPDYIDPSWLTEAARRPCRSLDPFFAGSPAKLRASFLRGARGADLCLVEGNHGLFDSSTPGESIESGSGSTAAVARTLQAPILLVLNAQRTGRSAAAIVLGCQLFEPDTPIAGVILNNVAHLRHENKLRSAIESRCGIPVLGVLPRHESLTIPDRHLGLIPRGEEEELLPALAACREAVAANLDLDAVIHIARSAPPFESNHFPGEVQPCPPAQAARIGVACDQAFSFYYPENLEALEAAGAKLVFLDLLNDPALPPVDGLYLGGGFPEIFMAELCSNVSMREDVRRAAAAGLPIYAECGGLMYLSKGIHWEGRFAEMASALPFEIEMTARPQGHGYVLAQSNGLDSIFPAGTELRGHEFHHSRLVQVPEAATAYHLEYGKGLGSGRDGWVSGNILASYTHLHADGCSEWAPGFVALAAGRRVPGGAG